MEEDTVRDAIDLDRKKLELEIKKLEYETSRFQEQKVDFEVKKLISDTSWLGRFSSKIWPIVATVITLYLSGFATYVSLTTQKQQALIGQRQKHQEALIDALKLATDGSGEVDRRIAGIWELKQSWQDPDEFEVTASVLSAQLTLPDKDRFARCAAAEVIGNAMSTGKAHQAELARLLYGNRDGEIGLVIRQHQLMKTSGTAEQATNSCLTALDATREAIRKNWRYLHDVNLNDTDLSKIQLYSADLSGAVFLNSKVNDANFRCSNLSGAVLTGTNWETGDFRFANVRDATPEAFRAFAIRSGAVEMSDADWQAWRNNGFRIDQGKPVNAPNGAPVECLHSASYPATVVGTEQ
jgi:hypothetical protein